MSPWRPLLGPPSCCSIFKSSHSNLFKRSGTRRVHYLRVPDLQWVAEVWQHDRTQASSPSNGPLTRYVKLRVVYVPGMPGTFSPPLRVSDPDMHHGTCVTHGPWCMPGSLTSGFLWSQWWGKRSRHSRRMHNPQFYVSGKRHMTAGQHVPFKGHLYKTYFRKFSASSIVSGNCRPSVSGK